MDLLKIQNIFWKIARHHCLIFVVLMSFALVWGGLLFFNNFVLLKELGPTVALPRSIVDQEAYEELAKTLDAREGNLKNVELKSYLNLFEEATSTIQ